MEGGAPTAPSGVLARAHSPASALLEALAAVTGVPLDQLSIALPPPAERPPLSAQLLATLSSDDPEVLGASSLVRRPLVLADGAVVGVRDRNHPPPQMPDGGGEGGGAGGRRRRIVFGAEPPEGGRGSSWSSAGNRWRETSSAFFENRGF